VNLSSFLFAFLIPVVNVYIIYVEFPVSNVVCVCRWCMEVSSQKTTFGLMTFGKWKETDNRQIQVTYLTWYLWIHTVPH